MPTVLVIIPLDVACPLPLPGACHAQGDNTPADRPCGGVFLLQPLVEAWY